VKSRRLRRAEGESSDEFEDTVWDRGHDVDSAEARVVEETSDAGDEVLEISEDFFQSEAAGLSTKGSKRQYESSSESDKNEDRHTHRRLRAVSAASTASSLVDLSDVASISLPVVKGGKHGADDISEFFVRGSMKGG
jgi:hypothetical protein